MQPKILVIGSEYHTRASCVDWLEPFPNIEEYEFVIINLQSLTQEIYDKSVNKITQIKQQIETIFDTDREVFCVMNKQIIPTSQVLFSIGIPEAEKSKYILDTNYGWLPFRIVIDDSKKGSSIHVSDHIFDKYFECLSGWNFVISPSYKTFTEALWTFSYDFVPIATNLSKKMIGATLKHGGSLKKKGKGKIHLLPPPTKCDTHQAIEIILDIICGVEEKVIQPWRKDIEIPGIEDFERMIEKKIKEIGKIQQEISHLRNQMLELDSYRDLLSTTGDELETIVQKTLLDIGIKTKKTEKMFPVDLISKEVAVEVTGIKGTLGQGSKKVNQTGIFYENYKKDEKIILIANTHGNLSPDKRKGKIDFSSSVVKYFESMGVCCLTTLTLFQLWKEVRLGKVKAQDVRRKIMTQNGELRLDEAF